MALRSLNESEKPVVSTNILQRGKVALVTGGTSGIGLALVKQLQALGMTVFFCARDSDRVAQVARELPGTTGTVCDASDATQLEAMAADVAASTDRLDLLVANVGGLEDLNFCNAPLPIEHIASQICLNLTAPALTVNTFLPLLRKSGSGQIVFIGSGFGWSPSGRAPLYSAAKAGVRAFAKALRSQLGSQGIAVMEVVPPTVDTPAVAQKGGKKIPPETVAAATIAGISKGKREVFVGQTKAMPWLLRLAPYVLERITLSE